MHSRCCPKVSDLNSWYKLLSIFRQHHSKVSRFATYCQEEVTRAHAPGLKLNQPDFIFVVVMSSNGSRSLALQAIYILSEALWRLTLILYAVLQNCRRHLQCLKTTPSTGVGAGKTVLVTTGRQAKTLHVVRALKEVGANVIVTDYECVSASAVSLACDHFVTLPRLEAHMLPEWIDCFGKVIDENKVDLVVPCSTINEVLFLAVAKDVLSPKFPHVQWMCMDLETVVQFDDRTQFGKICLKYGVPAPESGRVESRERIPKAHNYPHGIICKRIESSVNRDEEVVPVRPGHKVPALVKPSLEDPWQWQHFVRGQEFSVWYICLHGRVTFSACYESEPDLVHFDAVPVPSAVDKPLRNLIRAKKLSGQYAFDFIKDDQTGQCFVIECNPRASSILETVSATPLWGEAFFGVNISFRRRSADIGFVFHRNCWPWKSRKDGYFSVADPLPFIAGEIVWPLRAIYNCAAAGKELRKIDVNICKAICDGPSIPRSMTVFRNFLTARKLKYLEESLKFVDCLFVDTSVPELDLVLAVCKNSSCHAVPFCIGDIEARQTQNDFASEQTSPISELEKFCTQETVGSYRVLLGPALSNALSFVDDMALLCPDRRKKLSAMYPIPLRRMRILHVVGSCSSMFYEDLSSYYASQCIESLKKYNRVESVIAYIHTSKEWSISSQDSVDVAKQSQTMTIDEALKQIDELNVDVMLPHMFDYTGLTAYRSLFDILDIPGIGCPGEALALSTNKAWTKACAEIENVLTPHATVVRSGDEVTMEIPFVVKPLEEDNSIGVELVRHESEKDAAVKRSLASGRGKVICEQFIPLGSEIRVGVIEKPNGDIHVLPLLEYVLSDSSPMRMPDDKLTLNAAGMPTGQTKTQRICPAVVDKTVEDRLKTAARICHKALGCCDYSIYDFRVSPENEPYLLESCLYCSYAPTSVLIVMGEAEGMSHEQLFMDACDRACSRTRRSSENTVKQLFGMKANEN